VDVLMERNDHLEKENANLKKEGDRMEKALKQGKRDVHQLKGKHDGLSTTATEISRALVSFLSFMKALLTHEPISIKILKFLLKTIYISGFFKSTKM
jgi:metallophosphoesterase superfamily enzyme